MRAAGGHIPLSLYVHVPWCVAKCPYCDFNSHVARGDIPASRYVAAVAADLDFELERRPAGSVIVSVYLGGGTPSLLPAEALARLLEDFRARLALAGDAEITLEANPGTVERGRFGEYAAAGVNRISLGVQSFDDAALRRLGRIHTAREAEAAVDELHAAGMENFNLDLMYALPGQSETLAQADVERALALAPAHLSYYELTLEPGTAFYRRPPPLPAEALAGRIEARGRARLAEAGYERYEISAFARAGRRSRHNENYWLFGDYIGLGPGAHGKRSRGGEIVRTERTRSPDRYLRLAGRPEIVAERQVEGADRLFEFMLGALRRPEGFRWHDFYRRTGLDRAAAGPGLRRARQAGLVLSERTGVRPTARGLVFLNELLGLFLPA